MIRAGDLRHVVRIEQRSATVDAVGEQLNTWSLFVQRRAAIDRTPGREVWSSQERQGRVPTVFRMRWHDGVLPAMRLIHDEKVFNILSVIDPDNGRGAEMLITCEELVEVAQ